MSFNHQIAAPLISQEGQQGNGQAGVAVANSETSSSSSGSNECCLDCCLSFKVDKIKRLFRSLSIFNGLCISFVGVMEVFAWTTCSETKCCLTWQNFSKIFLPLYTFVAGILLAVAEMRLDMFHSKLAGSCGFLFSYNLRIFYIILAGTLCFSMECSAYSYIGYLCGSYSVLNAIVSCYIISNHPGMVELTGHDDIDNSRLMQNYGFGTPSPYSSNEGWGSNYSQPAADAHENPYELESLVARNSLPSSEGHAGSDAPKDGVEVAKAGQKDDTDVYLNPFAADNTF
jgi:hypothetical protein